MGIFGPESMQGAALDKTIDDVSPPAPSGRHYEGDLSGRKFPGQFKIVVSVSCNTSMWCCQQESLDSRSADEQLLATARVWTALGAPVPL